ncbi:MAG: translation elongation factor Ts [Ignavibacteriota bacterium]|nr:translation elongation factor Ts [Ignavibacteriota bacterium]
MAVTIELIKDLREKSGAGMADCKKALEETNGDIPKAIEYLRKKGAAMATKRADKIAKEGAVKSSISEDKSKGVIVEINCETDFVAKGDGFQNFTQNIANIALANDVNDAAHLLGVKGADGLTVQEIIDGMMGSVGEKIELRRVRLIKVDGGFVSTYIHFGSKVGAIVGLKGKFAEEANDIGQKIAMQVVAMTPINVRRDEVSADVIEKELEIFQTQARNEKKPENIIEKITMNRLEKFFQENCLLEQEYIQDSSKNIGDLVKEYAKKTGDEFDVTEMARFQLG